MQEHRPREETIRVILEAVASARSGLTRAQIARAIGRRKTPHLIELIDQMVVDGLLWREVITLHNGVQGYRYHVRRS